MKKMTSEMMSRIQVSLENPELCSKEDLLEILRVLFQDYETLLCLGKTQRELEACPSMKDKPNPLDLEIGFSFQKTKKGYRSPCGEFELNHFGKKWGLTLLSKGETQTFTSKRDAVNRVKLYHASEIIDQMWDLGYHVKKNGFDREKARIALVSRGNLLLADRNLRVQDESLDRIATYIANLFCV